MKSDAIVYAAEGLIAETKAMLRLFKRGGYEGEKKLVVISSLGNFVFEGFSILYNVQGTFLY
jgi:hypothetical protein